MQLSRVARHRDPPDRFIVLHNSSVASLALYAALAEDRELALRAFALEVADEVCDEVTVIHRGRIIAQGSPESLRQQTGSEGLRLEEVFLQLTAEAESVSEPA